MPDTKTACVERELLAEAGTIESLFKEFKGHLARQGYIARGGQIRDASIVPLPKNRNTRNENKTTQNDDVPEDLEYKPTMCSQKDRSARWTKKHGKSHYGYKNHVNADRKHTLVRRYDVTCAAVDNSQAVDYLLMRATPARVCGRNQPTGSRRQRRSCAT